MKHSRRLKWSLCLLKNILTEMFALAFNQTQQLCYLQDSCQFLWALVVESLKDKVQSTTPISIARDPFPLTSFESLAIVLSIILVVSLKERDI